MLTSRRRHTLSLLLWAPLVASLCSCIAPSSRRPTTAAPTAVPATVTPNTNGPWMISAAPVSQKVLIATEAVVVLSGDPSTRTDTLRTVLGASYVQPADRRRVDGLLSDFRISVGRGLLTVPAGLQLGRPFSADGPSGGQYSFRLPAENTACTDPTLSALQGVRDAWIPLPDTLRIGREWSDTLRAVTCRDRIVLRVTAVLRFRVQRAAADSAGRVVVSIVRSSKGHLAGAGDQFGEAVSIEGESEGTVVYAFDPAAGRLIHAEGKTSLSFTLTSRRRTQAARQESQVSITWLP